MSSILKKGDSLPVLSKPPITAEQLRMYAEASEDHNPIHVDEEVAKKVGLPGVIAHGMLVMAFMAEFLHQALSSAGIKDGRIFEMNTRFKAMTFPGDTITVTGLVKDVLEDPQSQNSQAVIDFEAKNQRGEAVAIGHAFLVM